MTDPLEHMARRAEGWPDFLAWALAEYARWEGLDDSALAAKLGCAVEALVPLRLCRLPDDDPAGFQRDVDALAAGFGIDGDVLASVVRRARSGVRFRQAPAGGGGVMAARDRPAGEAER
jgi:hypothetical protein